MEKKQLDFTAPLLSVRRRDLKAIHEKTVPDRQNTLLAAGSDLNFDHVTKPGAVPFVWEDIPGKARKELENCDVVQNQAQVVALLGSNEKGSCDMENYDDGAYTNVLDALSQSTVSRDCSVSSWSESDGHGLEPSRTFCPYHETHDFILRSFLPAAKAMTLELPCHVFKKRPSVFPHEQPTVEIKEMVSAEDQKPLLKRNDSWTATYFEQGKEEQESEPEVDHYSEKSTITMVKSRSFLPRFCIKSSSSLLNQVVGMQHTIKSPKGCKGKARRHKKAYRGPLPTPLIRPNIYKHAIYNHICDDAMHTAKPNHARNSGHLKTTGRSSLTPNRVSPYRKKVPVSPSRQMMGSTGIHKAADQNSRECRYNVNNKIGHNKTCDQKVTPDQTNELGPGPDHESPPIEKTLHMDLVKAFINLHPPLPKSPSDSWLSRTLPSVPSRSSSPHSRKVSLTLTPSSSTKWENIVKTSYLHRDHVRYSQELVSNVGKQRLRT